MARIAGHYSRELVAVEGRATCREAAQVMVRNRIGAAAVRDGERIVGLITERDLASRVIATGVDPDVPATTVMRRDLPMVRPDASEVECATLMREHFTRHLLVADGGRVVGIISMKDVIQLMLDEKESLIEQLQRYIAS
jgi:CBS domain-containing protein